MREVDHLREYVDRLLAVIGVDSGPVAEIRRAFPKMEPDQARILAMLMKREFVTRDGLYTVMYTNRPECDWPDEKVLDVQFHRLRSFLDPLCIAIQTVTGEGWFMAKAEKVKVRSALDQAPLLDFEAMARLNDQRNKRHAVMDSV